MNGTELIRLIDSISRDRNVDKEALYTDIEQAMVSAARKHFNALDTDEFTCELDRLNGSLVLFRGEEEIDIESLGRIPAQTAKQVMIQRFREDERQSIYDEYADRMGELVTGMAQRYEGGALVVSVGRAEGFMPRSEQIPGEQHQPGERVRCMILDVRDSGSQVKIVLTRAHPDFIRRLFEVEVPEVAERIIEVKGMAREPGHRTKLAVSSIDSKVDAVGACVGVRGSRIKNIVDELGGEKIDIVRWNESSQILIQNSLKPAEVVEINLCFELGRATVVVNEDQLSLAIGKRGQNVRLGARLTNWDIDILTPVEFSKSLERMVSTLTRIDGMEEENIDRLAAMGMISVFDVEEVGAEYIAATAECDMELAERVVTEAIEEGRIVAEEQAKEKEEAERMRAEGIEPDAAAPGAAQAAAILGGAIPEAGAGDGDAGDQVEIDGAADDQAAAILGGPIPEPAVGEAASDTAADAESDVAHDSSGEQGRTIAEAQESANNEPDASEPANAIDQLEEQDDEEGSEVIAERTESDAGVVASGETEASD